RRFADLSVAFDQRAIDAFAFRLSANVGEGVWLGSAERELRKDIFWLQYVLTGKHAGTLETVAKFTNIARPFVVDESRKRFRRDGANRQPMAKGCLHQQTLDKRLDFRGPVAQRRQRDFDHRQAII